MKLFMFQCGTIITKKHLLVEGSESNKPFKVPVPFFLIEHLDGNVLFDTGQPMSAANCATAGNYIPVMNEADHISSQLGKTGLRTTDISHIVLSHLHSDHAGGLNAFRSAICYIQKEELGNDNMNTYPLLNWRVISGDHDIFGDDAAKIVFTPGHTAGHQSLLVNLEKWGKTLLTGDAVYTEEILGDNVMPGVFDDREDTARTIEKIKAMRRNGVRVIAGHDPKAWKKFKLVPAYYE